MQDIGDKRFFFVHLLAMPIGGLIDGQSQNSRQACFLGKGVFKVWKPNGGSRSLLSYNIVACRQFGELNVIVFVAG